MRIPSTIVSLLVATCLPVMASVAVALPSSASSSLREAAVAPIQVAKHRSSRTHHRVAPAVQDDNDSYGAYNEGIDDWSQWSPTHHPGWPCISNSSEAAATSAYPAWEMKPQCK